MSFGLSTDSPAQRERDFPLPHAPVSVALFLILESALVEAWRVLHFEPIRPFDATVAIEVEYTTHLHEILEDHLLENESVSGFTRDVFTKIMRPEVRNFDGGKTSKKPDLVAALADRPNVKSSQDGIFIECKPVDAAHSLLGDYCDEGVTRFIIGDYAWAMTEALMVGYNTVHEKPSIALDAPFKNRETVVRVIGKLGDCKQSTNDPPIAISWHRRSFKLQRKQAPKIQLRHLWIKAPEAPTVLGDASAD